MQLITFTVAAATYAIESRRVIEVLPLVPAHRLPRFPAYVRGVFIYRGRIVPLIDLGLRMADVPLGERLGTRVMVVDCPPPDGLAAASFPLGLAAENVLGISSTTDADLSLPPLRVPDAPYLGRMVRVDGRTIQLLAVEHVLPPDLAAGLAAAAAATLPPRRHDAPAV